jgi:hypothetical protein
MMRDDFRLRPGALRLIAQRFGSATVQRLPSALEQALVGASWISACLKR